MLKPSDGPLKWMTEFLESQKNMAPEGWPGFRDLDKKQESPDFNMPLSDDVAVDQDAPADGSLDTLTQSRAAKDDREA